MLADEGNSALPGTTTAVNPSQQLFTTAGIRVTVMRGVWHTFSQPQPPSDPHCVRRASERNFVPVLQYLFLRGLPSILASLSGRAAMALLPCTTSRIALTYSRAVPNERKKKTKTRFVTFWHAKKSQSAIFQIYLTTKKAEKTPRFMIFSKYM